MEFKHQDFNKREICLLLGDILDVILGGLGGRGDESQDEDKDRKEVDRNQLPSRSSRAVSIRHRDRESSSHSISQYQMWRKRCEREKESVRGEQLIGWKQGCSSRPETKEYVIPWSLIQTIPRQAKTIENYSTSVSCLKDRNYSIINWRNPE